ncbi:MAG: LytR C-terminal domain-containing protein [Sphingomicrobium sp.]
MREVELITVPAPRWRTLTVARSQRSATVGFVPLKQVATRFAGVRILNAARVDRLAARTRLYLAGRGWRAISIGNAPTIRMRSVILYPANRRRVAERLSTQFGFAIAQRAGAVQVTILLGRDAARDSALRARS